MTTFSTLKDAEAGLADTLLPPNPSLFSASGTTTRVNSTSDLSELKVVKVSSNEKVPYIAALPVVTKKDSSSPPSKPKRKRASRWIRFKLWYNTYRYACMNSHSPSLVTFPVAENSSLSSLYSMPSVSFSPL